MANNKVKILPIRAIESVVTGMPYQDGAIYFTTDTNKIYLDVKGTRHLMGGSSSGIAYASGNDSTIVKRSEDDNDKTYLISASALDNPNIIPIADALIINSDGRFFRVVSVEDTTITAVLLAVSGSGSGSGGPVAKNDLTLTFDNTTIDQTMTFISGQDYNALFTATSETDSVVSLSFIVTNNAKETLYTFLAQVPSGEAYAFNTKNLPVGNNLTLTVTATAANSANPNGVRRVIPYLNVVEMGIAKSDSMDTVASTAITGNANTLIKYYLVGGTGLVENLHVAIDGNEDGSLLKENIAINTNEHNVAIPKQSHGVHTISLWVSTVINEVELNSNKINYELAWVDSDNDVPIIWVEEYPSTVIQYETFSIHYKVYDPNSVRLSSAAEVQLYREGVLLSTNDIQYDANGGWLNWDLTELYQVGTNHFSIRCGVTTQDITFYITTVGSRDLGLAQTEALMMNLSATGRSNDESADRRAIWTTADGTYTTEFSNFNWYNNGWRTDVGKNAKFGSYLSVANGASAKIKFKELPLNSGTDYTIELRFRVRNVQEYSTLVRVDPHYFITINGVQQKDSISIDEIKEKGYTTTPNADGYAIAVDPDGNWLMDQAHSPKKVETKKGVCLSYIDSSGNGFCVGTQEAFFKTPAGTVNVRYKEDEIINMAFVISASNSLISIYLNGILSGETSLKTAGVFTVRKNTIDVNSEYCDIDLYKIRVYEYGLSMPEVIHNYISDIHDISLYDQNQLTKDSDPTALSYKKVVEYNKTQHDADKPDELTMPYATIEIIDNKSGMTDPNGGTHADSDDRLPYKKGNDRYCKITFTNPSLDYAYEHGKITLDYYINHCPSYVVTGAEINVQGTSSQGYPRRNYKTKMKSAVNGQDGNKVKHDDWKWEYSNEKVCADLKEKGEKTTFKKWHEDNATYATNKFTWKIDYMESSGSYNTGFANLVGKMYSKHPLEDYKIKDLATGGMRTSVYGFPLMVFWKHSTSSDLAKVGTKNEDDIYEYLGRFNMNLDKGSNEYYGFEEEEVQPYVSYTTEQKTKKDKTTGEDVPYTEYTLNSGLKLDHEPTISDVSECWELTDNQGTWTSFSYPTTAKDTKFKTMAVDSQFPKLEALNHFEYRYISDDKKMDEAMAGTIGDDFANYTELNDYLYKKYYNLEQVFNWLDSTDSRKATNAQLDKPVTFTVTGATRGDVEGKNVTYVREEVEHTREYTEIGPDGKEVTKTETYHTTDITHATYSTDCVGYRLNKFKTEFKNWFDEEYCSVYYVMTELLLCYDSRGKNLMLATYGPHEKGGNYIWYPIFYDIDTQLGLNNIGATLWDYDTDATADLTFSTPSSVLWNNFYEMFNDSIQSKYRDLRSASRLTYETIEGSYLCDPSVFDSYAMRGLRPIIAIGLDEYVKYIAPSITGYYNTDGDVVMDTNAYAYAVNGDRKLSRQLFLRNRLNYIDSWWMAGSYTSESAIQTGVRFRANANNKSTSDTYLDSGSLTSLPENAKDYTLAKYPVPYFDATPEFTITPFLSQYVFTFNDKIPSGTSKKYNGTVPVTTTVSDSVAQGYKMTPGFPEQIIYIPGGDYLSSMGDLSLKYPSQLTIMNGKRLLDLTVGSDVPGYNNALLGAGTGQFEMNDSATNAAGDDNPNKKTLLEKVVLSNLTQLKDAIDVSGSEKLIEFRALGTQIPRAIFAEGAPLDTIHLPNTINGLNLVEPKNLTKILETKPVVCTLGEDGVAKYADKDSYKGLYLEGVTDATSATSTTNLATLSIIGGGLGYDSYKLLKKVVDIKKKMVASDSTASVALNFENVKWSPYEVLATDATYDSTKTYYRLTDHSNFVTYTFTTADDWKDLLLNGKLFTYNADAEQSTITDTSLFDLFLKDYEEGIAAGNRVNHYTNTQNSGHTSVPNITGSVFISNADGTAINEEDITSKYQVRWPNLNFYAAKVNEAYVAKYVQLTDSGKEQELEVLRSAKTETIPKITSKIPTKSYYDFKGYATDKAGTNIVIDYNADSNTLTSNTKFDSVRFSDTNSVITFYAIFIKHPYVITYKNPDDSVITTMTATYGDPIPDPKIKCTTDESALERAQTYAFKGYTKEKENSITTANKLKGVLLNLSKTSVTQDTSVYACYVLQSVYDEPLDSSYFEFTDMTYYDSNYMPASVVNDTYNVTGGVRINLKKGVVLSGKITLPTYSPDGKPVVAVGNSFRTSMNDDTNTYAIKGACYDVTHVFWYKEADKEVKLRAIDRGAFSASFMNAKDGSAPYKGHLKYIELPESLRVIDYQAFAQLNSLDIGSVQFPSTLAMIGATAFNNAFDPNSTADTLLIPGNVQYIGTYAFAGLDCKYSKLQIGDMTHGSKLQFLGNVQYDFVNDTSNNYFYTADNYIFETYSGNYPSTFEFYYTTDAQNAAIKTLISNSTSEKGILRYMLNIATLSYIRGGD